MERRIGIHGTHRCTAAALIRGLVLLAASSLFAGNATAAGIVSIALGPNAGPAVSGVNPNATGQDMAGAVIDAVYSLGPPPESVLLNPTGSPGEGQAVGTHWTITLNGDSDAVDWVLLGDAAGGWGLSTLTIDLAPAGFAFDLSLPSPGSPGSGPGQDFLLNNHVGLSDFDILYDDHVEVGGTVYDDLFSRMVITFATSPFDANDVAEFRADTDQLVPEPATALLVWIAGAWVLGWSRRRPV